MVYKQKTTAKKRWFGDFEQGLVKDKVENKVAKI